MLSKVGSIEVHIRISIDPFKQEVELLVFLVGTQIETFSVPSYSPRIVAPGSSRWICLVHRLFNHPVMRNAYIAPLGIIIARQSSTFRIVLYEVPVQVDGAFLPGFSIPCPVHKPDGKCHGQAKNDPVGNFHQESEVLMICS